MSTYHVLMFVDASKIEEIEANSPKEALEKADTHVSVCQQCSDKVDVTGVYRIQVLSEDTSEVLYDDDDDAVKLPKEYEEIKKRHAVWKNRWEKRENDSHNVTASDREKLIQIIEDLMKKDR